MAKLFITPVYTFTPAASGVGTVNMTGIANFDVKRLVAIINQTRGVVIYATGSTTLKYTGVSGTTVTLNFDTTGHSSGDTLQIIYDTPEQPKGTIFTTQMVVGTTPVRATVDGFAPQAGRTMLIVKPSKNNTGTASIYIGSSAVATTNGVELISVDAQRFPNDSSDYYLVSDTAGQIVELMEKF